MLQPLMVSATHGISTGKLKVPGTSSSH